MKDCKRIDKKLKNKNYFYELLLTNDRKKKLVTFLNPFSYNELLKNKELIGEFDVFFADSSMLVILHNLFNKNKIERVSFDFSSIADDVFEYAIKNNLTVSFIGAKKDELKNAIKSISKNYPKLQIVYTRNGYFNSENEYKKCFDDMKKIKIDILIIGMGSPYQERFAVKVKKEKMEIQLICTCGGFLTQTSIRMDYYWGFVKKSGLRWLQRAILHKHVRYRLIHEYPIFFVQYIKNHLKNR